MTDIDAVALAQQGCEDAFRVLYDRYRPAVCGRCSKVFQNESEAEDLTQDIFLNVWLKLKDFRRDCAFHTWLHIVTTNQIRDRMRKKSRRCPTTDLETMPDVPTAPPQLLRAQLNDALAGLSAEDSSYLQAAVSGYSLAAIARQSRQGAAMVRRRLQTARTKIGREVG